MPIFIFTAGLLVVGRARWIAVPDAARRAVAVLGLMTYPIYLLHQEIGAMMLATMLRNGLTYSTGLVVTVIAVLVSTLVILLIDCWPRRCLEWAIGVGAEALESARRDSRAGKRCAEGVSSVASVRLRS